MSEDENVNIMWKKKKAILCESIKLYIHSMHKTFCVEDTEYITTSIHQYVFQASGGCKCVPQVIVSYFYLFFIYFFNRAAAAVLNIFQRPYSRQRWPSLLSLSHIQ